jgi:hypothetical protein
MKRVRAPSLLFFALLVGALAVGVKVGVAAWSAQAQTEATELVQRAASTLGLTVGDFSGPQIEDKGILGGNVYRWERQLNGEPVEELAYDSIERIVCWSNKEGGVWHSKGCITPR